MSRVKYDAIVGESSLYESGTSGEYTYTPEKKVRALLIAVIAFGANVTADSALTVDGTGTTSLDTRIPNASPYPWAQWRFLDLGEEKAGPFKLKVTKNSSVKLRMIVVGIRSASKVETKEVKGSNENSGTAGYITQTWPSDAVGFFLLVNGGKSPTTRGGTMVKQRSESSAFWDIQRSELASGSHLEYWEWSGGTPTSCTGVLLIGSEPVEEEPPTVMVRVGGGLSLPTPDFNGDFETGDLTQWTLLQDGLGESYGPVEADARAYLVETDPGPGKYALHVEHHVGDKEVAGGPRTELTAGTNYYSGAEIWIWVRWRWLAVDTSTWQLVTQLHHDGGGGSPPVELLTDFLGGKAKLWLGGYGSTEYFSVEKPANETWHYALIYTYVHKTEGKLAINLNGTDLTRAGGGGTVKEGINTLGTEGTHVYPKLGIYRNSSSTGTAITEYADYRIFTAKPSIEALLGEGGAGEWVSGTPYVQSGGIWVPATGLVTL